jgi:hypothetical protein
MRELPQKWSSHRKKSLSRGKKKPIQQNIEKQSPQPCGSFLLFRFLNEHNDHKKAVSEVFPVGLKDVVVLSAWISRTYLDKLEDLNFVWAGWMRT